VDPRRSRRRPGRQPRALFGLLAKLLLIAGLAALPLLATTTAQAGKGMEVAIQDDGVFVYNEYSDMDEAYQRLRALGATHLRMNVLWWQVVPAAERLQTTTPAVINYDWGVLDQAIARAATYGIKVQLDLTGDPPSYACGSKLPPYSCDGFKPDRALFAHFVGSAVAHFRGRVSRFSLWNEPNWFTWISPHDQAPLLYRRLYQAGYAAAKAANPDAEIVMGEFAPHFQRNISTPPLQFIREMVCVNKKLEPIKGAKRKCKGELEFDAVATHPYDFTNRPTRRRENPDELTIANINSLPRLLDRLRKKGLVTPSKRKFPVYLTEHGYFVSGRRGVPETTRKNWIVKAWQMALEAPRIKQNLHFVFISPPAGSPSSFFDMGLIASNGVLRPSYDALRGWISQAAAAGKVQRPGPCSAC
jgi:hypothetical protein